MDVSIWNVVVVAPATIVWVIEALAAGLLNYAVPAAELDAKVNDRLDGIKDRVRIPGFRPGKVPVSHLKRVYGKATMAEVIEATVREANNRGQGLVVSGCLSQRFRDELPKLFPEVDAFIGLDQLTAFPRLMFGKLELAEGLSFVALAITAPLALTRRTTGTGRGTGHILTPQNDRPPSRAALASAATRPWNM